MKKLLKENLKIIIIILITTVVATTTTIFAYSLIAENVGYTPKDTTWNVENVEAALNNLNLRENQLSTYYSTEEQVVGEWIDGKPLYQKTYSLSSRVSLPQNTWTTIVSDSNLSSIETLVYFRGIRTGTGEERRTDTATSVKIAGTSLQAYAPVPYVYFNIITIQYTKTTD